MHRGDIDVTKRTYDPALVFLQLHGVGLYDHLDQDDAILVSSANAFHETSGSHRLLIDQVRELWDINACRARRERGEGEALSHGRGGWGVI